MKRMRFSVNFAACLLVMAMVMPAAAEQKRWIGAVDDDLLEGTAWGKIGEQYGLDSWLLYAISIEESNHFNPRTGKIYPWRWVIHYDGELTYHDNEDQARAHINRLEARGVRNYDVGPLQINRAWHGDRVASAHQLLGVHKSLEIAAEILTEARALSPSDKQLWVGRYRSWKDKRARAYANRIFHIRRQLPQGGDYKGYGEPIWRRH